jgi:hypothetical protein
MQRKIVYSVGILVLFTAIFPYKQYLQAEAVKKDLGEATIGEVDTGSFVLKLFLLGGFRGMAANVLWTRAIDFQKVQEWDRLKVTVDMITKLQPHFLAIWTFQSWNLTYNVSVEWDAPEDKYEWIKSGIKFVQDGVSKNKKSPDLIWDTAWYYYHKLGFSDCSMTTRTRASRRARSTSTSIATTSSSATTGSSNRSGWSMRAKSDSPWAIRTRASNTSMLQASARDNRATWRSGRCPLTLRLAMPSGSKKRA